MEIRKLLGCLLTLFCSAAYTSEPLPAWQGLAFEQHTLWATAQSVISLDARPGAGDNWQLTVSSSVARSSEEIILSFSADTGRAARRTRLSRGKDQRVKTYVYGEDAIVRERREPTGQRELPQSEWPLSSEREINYPGDPNQPPVTTSYALTVLADRFRQSGESSAQYVVHTDLNFYRVTLSRGESKVIDVDYTLQGDGQVSGKRRADCILVRAVPEGPQEDKADFSLLGLGGEISLYYDKESGLLLQLRGVAPRLGKTSIDLTAATLRDTP